MNSDVNSTLNKLDAVDNITTTTLEKVCSLNDVSLQNLVESRKLLKA